MKPAQGDRLARVVAIAVPVAGGVIGLVRPESVLMGGVGWLLWLGASLAGWGALVARITRCSGGIDLRWAWGAAAYLAVSGWLMAAGLLRAPVQLALQVVGMAALVREIVVAPTFFDPRTALRGLLRRPAVAIYGLVVVIALVNTLGAVAHLRTNVYDDDIAYTTFVERLLQVGDLDEPFGFRRISSYGGQTILSAMAGVRGTLSNVALVDHGLFRLMTLALVVGLARARARKTGAIDHLFLGVVLVVLVVLPDTSINGGSHWSGVALFLALYRTATLDGDQRGRWFVIGVLAAAAACLRQNYLVVAGGFVVATLLLSPRPLERRRWLAAAAGAAACLLPYAIAAWRTCGTPLYPLLAGSFNPDVHLSSDALTWWQELAFFFRVVIEPTPIRVMLPLALVLFSIRDRRPGRPLVGLAIAASVGFVATVHGFSLSDPPNLWRYGFGFMTAWLAAALLEPEPSGGDDAPVTTPALARLIALVCLIAQLAIAGPSTARSYASIGRDLDAAMSPRVPDAGERASYRDLQNAAEPDATIAALLDRPYLLDYRRNRIVNLDVPGYVSPAPGLPSFSGAEAVADYFHAQGIRYLAFVRPDRSRYFYRRTFWVLRTFFDTELWRVMGAYMVDFIDTAGELASSRTVLFDRDGLVLVDLEARR